ncbi:MAG: class I SAM-dependent RNA methyltransferase [Planctomycetota bacterium]|nr:MAG: class I SAM-dependent RNA methyltransferase [Planctomycetota bacterium]
MNTTDRNTIMVTCAKGLSGILRGEIEALGFSVNSAHETGAQITGDLYDCMKLNLHLRTAFNVLYLLKHFDCRTPDQLYKHTAALPWEEIISPEEYLCVIGRIETPTIENTMFANLKIKDAIVDRIMQKEDARPDSGKERDNVVVQAYWKNEKCWIYLNTSGRKISDRNYRKMPCAAPLRESLAAAIILTTGYDGSQPLICPMCGSGTLAIEAALIASHRVPGLMRANYAFMHTLLYDDPAWQQMRTEAGKQSKKRGKAEFKPAPIIATDIDPDAVRAAQKNAMTAGVEHLIDFKVCDFAETPVEPDAGSIIVMNPEYGMRLGETKELEETYGRIGDFFKQKCAGSTGYIFTGNPQLGKKVGLRTSRKIPFYNATIECRLLKYKMYSGTRKNKNHE